VEQGQEMTKEEGYGELSQSRFAAEVVNTGRMQQNEVN